MKGIRSVGRGHCARLRVTNMGAEPVVDWADGGIVCVAAPLNMGRVALIGVFDETDYYGGASATNAMDKVLTLFRSIASEHINFGFCNFIQVDSMGLYDLVIPRWSGSKCADLSWMPVKWPACKPRSYEAFLGAFASQAVVLTETVGELKGLRRRSALAQSTIKPARRT